MSDDANNQEERPLIADVVNNQPVAARVPEHVAAGSFSTGSIVTTGANEFIIDFVLRMGQPHRLAARVVVPPAVAAQFTSMLEKGIASYERHFGPAAPPAASQPPAANASPMADVIVTGPGMPPPSQAPQPADGQADETPPPASAGAAPTENAAPGPPAPPGAPAPAPQPPAAPTPPPPAPVPPPVQNRPGSLRDTYDELKVEDTVVSGAYANAVMVSHTDTVFQFDFITNFLPFSAVAKRVFLPVSQAPRLLEAMKLTLRRYAQVQQQARRQQNEPPQGGGPGGSGPNA